MKEKIIDIFNESRLLIDLTLNENLNKILEISDVIYNCFKNGNKVLMFGNGGSAADSQHIAAEFVNRFKIERSPLPVLSLTTDTSIITSISNDYDYSDIFAKQIRAFGKPGDVAIGISTSGNSPNVSKGINIANILGLKTISFTGNDGGDLLRLSIHSINVPSSNTARIQEMHILIGHTICELIDMKISKGI